MKKTNIILSFVICILLYGCTDLSDTVLSFKTIPIILVILRKTIIFAHSDA